VLGRVVVERQQFVLIAGDLRDGLGELGAVGGLELPDRGAGVGSARLSLTWEIEQLADELTGILGHHVDLVSLRALHPRLKPAVLAEARPLYAA